MMGKTLLSTLLFNEGRREWFTPVLALACIIGIESVLQIVCHEFPAAVASDLLAQHIRQRNSAPDVIVYGDSVMSSGLLEPVLEKELATLNPGTEVEVVNYSIASTSSSYALLLFRRQVETGHLPRAIVLGYISRSYMIDHSEKYVARFAELSELPSLALAMPLENFLASLAARSFYTVRYREELRLLVLEGDDGILSFKPVTQEWEEYRADYVKHVLSTVDTPVISEPFDVARDFHPTFLENFAVEPFVDESLEDFFALAAQTRTPVFILIPPVPPALHAHRESIGYYDRWSSYLTQLNARYGVQIVGEVEPAYPYELFKDPLHLKGNGSMLFSRNVALVLDVILHSIQEKQSEGAMPPTLPNGQ